MRFARVLCLASISAALIIFACSTEPQPPTGCDGEAACPPNAVCREGRCVPVEVETDAGSDAGETADAGPFDAGEQDAGSDDAGADGGGEDAGVDAGEEDAGVIDAGCVFDAGNPPNLLPNPGFECGMAEPEGWVPVGPADLAMDTSAAHSDASSARLTATGSSAAMSLYPAQDAVKGAAVAQYCLSAWVTGSVGRTARVSIRTGPTGGAVTDTSFSAPITNTWQRLDAAVKTKSGDNVTVRVWMPNPVAGDELQVDDAQLWLSADGGCNER